MSANDFLLIEKSRLRHILVEGSKEEKSSGRAKCRICGEKIKKEEKSFSFLLWYRTYSTYVKEIDLGWGDVWKAIRGYAHKDCYPEFEPETLL